MKELELPKKFEDVMIRLLGEEDYSVYKESLSRPIYKALRVNTGKISVEDFQKLCPFHLSPIPWTQKGFYYDEKEDAPSRHPLYYAGLYYLQEPSAMVPASQIPIEEGDYVLDLCAAPGGKSTELAARIGTKGFLLSNDVSASRAKALIKNLEIFGAKNVCITCETPDRLAEHFPKFFDKILIDAPCSGEGMFRKSGSMITAWEQNGVEKFVNLQRQILTEAVKMLRPGGTILYSTCTFEPDEDEEAVEFLKKLNPDFKILPIKMYEGFEPGHPEWCQSEEARTDQDLRTTAHMFPHRVKGEGHYVSMVQDMSVEKDKESWESKAKGGYRPKKAVKNTEIDEFFSHVNGVFEIDKMELREDRLYYIPSGCPDLSGLRILRRGIYLGELKKNRFEPSQSLAMMLDANSFDQVLDITYEDSRALKYLKGETIDPGDKTFKKGYVLITMNGFPLGFAKAAGNQLKNKYLPGWRMA